MSNSTFNKLSDLAEVVDCEHKTAPIDQKGNFLSVRTTDLKKGRILYNQCNRVSFETYQLWTRRRIPKLGDIILSREAPVGEVGYIDKNDTYCLGQRTVLISPISKSLSGRYLSYYFQSPEAFEEMSSKSGGSVVLHLNMSDIRSMLIPLPPLPEQQAIAEVLSCLDDKIDLLHRNNKTLEEMAETLFRQWFVEGAKEDWEERKLDDILTTVGGTTPSTSNPEFWNGDIPWTSPRDITTLSGIYLFDTERKITTLGLKKVSSGLLPKGTLLMSSRAPVGVLAFAELSLCINQGYIAILDNKGFDKHFIYLWLKANMDLVHSYSNGSTFMEISKSAFRSLDISTPPIYVVNEFCVLIKPFFEKIKLNEIEILNLSNIRDTLLPKLMSGQVRVKTDK